MKGFAPNYKHMVDAAYNHEAERLPLYEHGFDASVIEKIIGELMMLLWTWLLENHTDSFAVCRFGDDLGFRSSTLIQPDEIRRHIPPAIQAGGRSGAFIR